MKPRIEITGKSGFAKFGNKILPNSEVKMRQIRNIWNILCNFAN
jgi:hypothetical protein